MEDSFSTDWSGGMIQVHYVQAHLLLCGLVKHQSAAQRLVVFNWTYPLGVAGGVDGLLYGLVISISGQSYEGFLMSLIKI